MRSTSKLSICDQSDQVRFVIETSQDNDMINHISLVNIEIKIELLGPIEQGTIYYEDLMGQ